MIKNWRRIISICENTLSSIIDYINHQINGMIDALKNFQKYAKEKKVTSLKEKSEMNNKTAEEINDKENKTTDEEKIKFKILILMSWMIYMRNLKN